MKINVQFFRSAGLYTGFAVSGHDAADINPDTDADFSVLCAAVSSAVQLTCNTLTECFRVPQEAVSVRPAENMLNQIALRLERPDPVQSEIIHGLLIHMQLLSEDFGSRISVKTHET